MSYFTQSVTIGMIGIVGGVLDPEESIIGGGPDRGVHIIALGKRGDEVVLGKFYDSV